MTSDEAMALFDEIIAFLKECGGFYSHPSADTQSSILECLAVNQYVLRRCESGKVNHFICYWKILLSDISKVKDKIKPNNICNGTVMYVVEHGSLDKGDSMRKVIKSLRDQAKGMIGVCWIHKGKEFVYYPSQKGTAVIVKETASICGTCYKKIPAQIVFDCGKVYIEKHCCSPERYLIEDDQEFYKWIDGHPYENVLGSFANIAITDRCNTTCKACYHKPGNTELSIPEIKALAFSAPLWIQNFVLTGGEPTTHSQFHRILQEIPNCGLITNGIKFADKDFLSETLKYTKCNEPGILPWMFSLNTKDSPLYNEKLKALENIRAMGFKVGIISTTIESIEEVPAIMDEFHRLAGVEDAFKIRFAFNIGEHDSAQINTLSSLVKAVSAYSQEFQVVTGLHNNHSLVNAVSDGLKMQLVQCPDKNILDLHNIGPTGPYQFTKTGTLEDVMVALIVDEGIEKGWINGYKLARCACERG